MPLLPLDDAVNRYAKFRMFEGGGPLENFRVLLVAGHVKVGLSAGGARL